MIRLLLLLLPLTLLAQIPGTFRVTGPVAPTATNSNYGAAVPVYNYGGLLTGLGSLPNLQNTNLYPLARRHAGQLAALTNGVIYQLGSDLTTWTIYSKADTTNAVINGLTVSGTYNGSTSVITNAYINAGSLSNLSAVTGNVTTLTATNAYISTASISNLTTLDTLTATNITSTGNLTVTTAGKGLVIKDNSNGRAGVATLNGGNPAHVTVANTTVTTNTLIFLTRYGSQSAHPVCVSVITNGVSFRIQSDLNGDSDQVFYLLVEKIP
jgi:hypothetical protein